MSTLASVVVRDVIGSRPTAGIEGRLFVSTDENKIYRDNGSTWDEVFASTAAANPSNQNDVTASRALNGTVYQNTHSTPLYVAVSAYDSSATLGVACYTDASNPPTTVVNRFQTPAANYPSNAVFVVLPNNYYKCAAWTGTATDKTWVEWY